MKAVLFVLATLLALPTAVANDHDNFDGCSRLYKFSGMDLAEGVNLDLVDASWIVESSDRSPVMLDFQENGLVDKLTLNSSEQSRIEHLLWRTTFLENQAWLILENDKNAKTFYRLDQTCDGIILNNLLEDDQLQLIYEPGMTESDWLLAKFQLIGSWSTSLIPAQFDEALHTCYDDSMISPEINWSFGRNSMFTVEVKATEISKKATGIWDLSQDGEYIILYFIEDDNPESVISTSVMRIAELTFDDLVSFQNALPASLGLNQCGHWQAMHYKRM